MLIVVVAAVGMAGFSVVSHVRDQDSGGRGPSERGQVPRLLPAIMTQSGWIVCRSAHMQNDSPSGEKKSNCTKPHGTLPFPCCRGCLVGCLWLASFCVWN